MSCELVPPGAQGCCYPTFEGDRRLFPRTPSDSVRAAVSFSLRPCPFGELMGRAPRHALPTGAAKETIGAEPAGGSS
jgi:hypothetical protein